MISLEEIKDWLRIDQDYNGDDNLLKSLIESSKAIIKAATGVPGNYDFLKYEDTEELNNLYLMIQRIIVTDLYNERSTDNKALTGLYIKLELEYRRALKNAES